MAASFTLTLDTTGPGGVAVVLAGGATHTATRDILAAISTTDTPTTGYQMKVWGDLDDTFAPTQYRATEANAPWIALNTSFAIRLSTGDGSKTVSVRLRDVTFNESTPAATDTITLDTTVPIMTISGPDVTAISKISGKNVASFSFSPDVAISAYKVKVVPSSASLENAGTQIPVTNGSTNMSGGAVAAAATVNCTINGADLELASAGDGAKVIKVFGQESGSGSWSV